MSSTTSSGKRVGVHILGTPQGAGGDLIRAGCSPQSQVDPAWMQSFQRRELLRHHEWGVVREHHAAGAHPQRGGGSGQVGDEHSRSGAGDRRHAVMLGHPESLVPELLDDACHPDGVRQGLRRGRSRGHSGEIEDRKGNHVLFNAVTAR